MKQMRIIYSGGFSEDERLQTKAVIYSNIITAFKTLLGIMDAENIGPGSESFQVNPAVVTGSRLTHLISYVFPSHRPR